MISAALLCVLLTVIACGLILLNKLRNVFVERNVKHLKPMFLFGNSFDSLLGKVHPWEEVDRLYRAFPEEDLVGHFDLMKPQLMARSPEMVESILVKDFSHFTDRISTNSKTIESPEDANLFLLQGDIWRAIRSKFSPLFTSGKLKYMYHSIAGCERNLETVLNNKNNQEVDMTDIISLFAMDVIGSSAFGIEPNLLQNPDSKFREMGFKIFSGSKIQFIKTTLVTLFPDFTRLLNIKGFVRKSINDYFFNVISTTMERRKRDGIERNDFVQMLLVLKEKGKVEYQKNDKGDDYLMLDKMNNTLVLEMSDNVLVGGAFTFILAGFHATAMTLAYSLFQLSQSPKVVERLREEIRQAVKGDIPTYEDLKDMPYLELVIKEVMRLHPTAPVLNRVCTKEYTCSGGLKIRKGERVLIPVLSLQLDPAYWQDPHHFDPERFRTPPKPGTYLPFGDGPRICIGMRFAMMEMKFALVSLISMYDFQLSPKTKLPLTLEPRVFLATPRGGIILKVTKRVLPTTPAPQ